jgi:hypothetical protein
MIGVKKLKLFLQRLRRDVGERERWKKSMKEEVLEI